MSPSLESNNDNSQTDTINMIVYLKGYMVPLFQPFLFSSWMLKNNASKRYEHHRVWMHAVHVRRLRPRRDHEVAVRRDEQDHPHAVYC